MRERENGDRQKVRGCEGGRIKGRQREKKQGRERNSGRKKRQRKEGEEEGTERQPSWFSGAQVLFYL